MKIASRAIIIHKEKILLVKHKGRDFFSLPGGKVNLEEDIKSAMRRELFEELGVSAEVGKLLYVHEFRYPGGSLSLEFFFWIHNGKDFLGKLEGEFTKKELAQIAWLDRSEKIEIMPKFLIEKIPVQTENDPLEYHSEL